MVVYVVILVGVLLFIMQMIYLVLFIYDAIRFRQYKTRSGVPFIGSLLLLLGLWLIDLPAVVIFLPIVFELSSTVAAWGTAKYLNPTAM
ncbi:hypothetical protein [Pseudaeromonas pectinilytica]